MQVLDAKIEETLVGDDGRLATACESCEADAGATGDGAVGSLRAVEVDQDAVHGDAIASGLEPRAHELERPSTPDPAAVCRLRAQRELDPTDLERAAPEVDLHVRQIGVEDDRGTLRQAKDGSRDERVDLVTDPCALGGDRNEPGGDPLEKARDVDVAFRVPNDRIAFVRHFERGFGGRSPIAHLRVMNGDLGSPRGRVEANARLRVNRLLE